MHSPKVLGLLDKFFNALHNIQALISNGGQDSSRSYIPTGKPSEPIDWICADWLSLYDESSHLSDDVLAQ